MTVLVLGQRDVRALAVGAILLVLLIGGFRGLPIWLAWRAEAVQSATDRSIELQKTRAAVVRVKTDLDSAEARVARFRELGSALFIAHQPAEASANLTAAIHEAARVSSVRVETIESRIDSISDALLLRMTASVEAAGDITGLASLLERLEGHRALLAVHGLQVQPHSVETPRHAIETLELRFSVHALALVVADSSNHEP